MVFIKIFLRLCHVTVRLPGFRDHHHGGFRQRTAGQQQEFKYRVKTAGVGAVRVNDRQDILKFVSEDLGRHHALPRDHGVYIAAQSIDFAVVTHEPVRLSAIPRRKGVGAEA